MIKFFRKIRQNLVVENKTGKYFKYAIGEIILVMIGILLALQVNNWNTDRTDRIRETKYLNSMVLDLKKDIAAIDELIAFRKQRIIGDEKIINHINGKHIENLDLLTNFIVNSIMERQFSPNNSTFLELSNSGNLSLIQNDSIKSILLSLEELYKNNSSSVTHETFDYREYISKSVINTIDIDKLFPVFSGEKTAIEQGITLKEFDTLLNNISYKNGLHILTFMSSAFIERYKKIKNKSQQVIDLIESQNQH